MISPVLEKLIDNELAWREHELALLKAQLLRDINHLSHFLLSSRAFIAITYAHYEGFTKVILGQAIADISQSGTVPSACAEPIRLSLFAGQLRKRLNALSNSDLLRWMCDGSKSLDALPFPKSEEMVDVGNLGVSGFVQLVQCLGIEAASFADFRRHIGRLADLRHRCAHGEKLSFDSSKTNSELAAELFELQSHIVLLMHALALAVLDVFEGRNYLARAST